MNADRQLHALCTYQLHHHLRRPGHSTDTAQLRVMRPHTQRQSTVNVRGKRAPVTGVATAAGDHSFNHPRNMCPVRDITDTDNSDITLHYC